MRYVPTPDNHRQIRKFYVDFKLVIHNLNIHGGFGIVFRFTFKIVAVDHDLPKSRSERSHVAMIMVKVPRDHLAEDGPQSLVRSVKINL